MHYIFLIVNIRHSTHQLQSVKIQAAMEHRCFLYCVLILTICSIAICDECVVYDFEQGFENMFNNNTSLCTGMIMWSVGNYENLGIASPHTNSTKYMYPRTTLSCSSSFIFQVTSSGVVEVNIFMEPESPSDQITIFMHRVIPNSNHPVVGSFMTIASGSNFVPGWRTAAIVLSGSNSYDAYVSKL